MSATQKYKLQFGNEINIFQTSAGTFTAHNNRIFGRGVLKCSHRTDMWWYASCSSFFLFGVHANLTKGHTSMYVSSCAAALNIDNSLTRAKMLLRKYDDTRQCNNPCKNGATCLHNENRLTFSCQCAPGFSGSTCAKIATIPVTAGTTKKAKQRRRSKQRRSFQLSFSSPCSCSCSSGRPSLYSSRKRRRNEKRKKN